MTTGDWVINKDKLTINTFDLRGNKASYYSGLIKVEINYQLMNYYNLVVWRGMLVI